MSLLTKETRKKWFKYLGLGEYNKANILKFQKIAFTDKKQHDGIYGKNTDIALRHWHHVSAYTKAENFKPQEFKCPCGKCTGYPTWMRANELKHVQTIRSHYGKPMTITSGLRCATQNRLVGGAADSAHMKGKAVDFYMPGVTDTSDARKRAINYIKKLKNHNFSYGNGIAANAKGEVYYKSAPGMGNALHTEVR